MIFGMGSMLLASLEFTDGGTRFLVFGAILLPAIIMTIVRSTWIVDYYFFVVCTNRLVRRLLDWNDGEYDSRPISSLTPLIISLLMLFVVTINYQNLSKQVRNQSLLLLGVLLFGCLLGIRNGISMIYSFLEYLAPLAVLIYAISMEVDYRLFQRWLRTTYVLASAMAVYAWFQWVEMPPWDAFWIEQSGMWTSMGIVESYRTAAFGTLESRGPFAWFMATVAIPMIITSRGRNVILWLGVALIVSSILPSTVRSAFGIIALAVIGYVLTRGITKSLNLVFALGAILGALVMLRQFVPETELIFNRLETVSDITNDSSFQGRVGQAQIGFGTAITNPIGFGLGSSGLGAVATGQSTLVFDNGYLEILTTFGLVGSFIGFCVIFLTMRRIYLFAKYCGDDASYLAFAIFFSAIGAILFSNWLLMSCASVGILCIAFAIVNMEQSRMTTFGDLEQTLFGAEDGSLQDENEFW
jgi:putative inorganic carbon (HCO3(-)) transporter